MAEFVSGKVTVEKIKAKKNVVNNHCGPIVVGSYFNAFLIGSDSQVAGCPIKCTGVRNYGDKKVLGLDLTQAKRSFSHVDFRFEKAKQPTKEKIEAANPPAHYPDNCKDCKAQCTKACPRHLSHEDQ
ncbi:hypothetical protein KAR91_32465 [Candidatus Pacearchaeota archaeon]|nr:hypothetical protein [Candidatus Pacearchaeota archaeon]